jgi:hypothetical protein
MQQKKRTNFLNINIQPIETSSVQSRFDYMKTMYVQLGGKENLCGDQTRCGTGHYHY